MKYFLIFIIRFYQRLLSGFYFGRCRFWPSCSQYWIEALGKHGFFKGTLKGVARLLRCNPLFLGGYDPP